MVWISVVLKEGYCVIVLVLKFVFEKIEEVSIGGSMMYFGVLNICLILWFWRKINFKLVYFLFVMWLCVCNELIIEFYLCEKCCYLIFIVFGKKLVGFGVVVFILDFIRILFFIMVSVIELSKFLWRLLLL